MSYSIPEILEIIKQQATSEFPIYLVGGALRDGLLGKNSRDLDFVVKNESINFARRIADQANGDFFILDNQRGTARVLINTHTQERIILDFSTLQGGSLEQDLRSRDFTINAMAAEVNSLEKIIDLFGGKQDIAGKVLRACSQKSFIDDPVRVLRALRLSQELGFSLLPETKKYLRKAVIHLSQVSIERQRDELFYILGGEGISNTLEEMQEFGILNQLLPELANLVGLQQSDQVGDDAWTHTLMAVNYFQSILQVLLYEEEYEGNNALLKTALDRLISFRRSLQVYFSESVNPIRPLISQVFFAAIYHDVGKYPSRTIDVVT